MKIFEDDDGNNAIDYLKSCDLVHFHGLVCYTAKIRLRHLGYIAKLIGGVSNEL